MEDQSSSLSPSELLLKVVVFAAVQLLIYLILSKSSDVFSTGEITGSSHGFHPSSSNSIHRMLAAVSDLSATGEISSSSSLTSSACAAAVSTALFTYEFNLPQGLSD
ncbi:hypothetical protein HPP92_023456 [Vanilla planifolia]|uniref:Uncharacterized protein n=1 Tax=Vanilla planifolia TaxID=51239 RepID=A0A835PRI4_VANPL|nr:hypothetical protein HPP92_023456 [Vanilla planifolia]